MDEDSVRKAIKELRTLGIPIEEKTENGETYFRLAPNVEVFGPDGKPLTLETCRELLAQAEARLADEEREKQEKRRKRKGNKRR